MRHHLILSALVFTTVAGCEKSSPPPPSATPQNQGGLSNLSETPQSLLGKSAAAGRDAARSLEGAQAQAAGMADEITGQAKAVTVGGLEFRPPTSWRSIAPENTMQALRFAVGADDGSAGGGGATCAFLAGIGGSVDANVERWKKAVTEPGSSNPAEAKVQKRTIPGGIKVTTVYSEGTYSSMAAGAPTPRPGYGFRGAIIEGGSSPVFVRLTGPVEQVAAHTGEFEQLVFGARKP